MTVPELLIALAGFVAGVVGAIISLVIWIRVTRPYGRHSSPSASTARSLADDEDPLNGPVPPRTRRGRQGGSVADVVGGRTHAGDAEVQPLQ